MSAVANLVPVYFPEEHVAAAYRLALRLAEGGPDTANVDASGAMVVAGWSAAQIERAYRESPEGMKLIFDGMIDHPDDVLTSKDLAGFLTHKPNADEVTVRGTMGAFANRCGVRYGRAKSDFPFRHWYVDGGFARYQMSAPVADLLRPLRDGVTVA